jgi:hypothetical protein
MYQVLYATDFGLEINLGMTPAEVQAKLGPATGSETLQGGVVLEEFYLPGSETARGEGVPELTLTYLNNKLAKLDNSYDPAAEIKVFPPFFIEPLAGVKLGLRKSDFVSALGESERGPAGEFWRFTAEDGSTITIRNNYTPIEYTTDELCSRLIFAWAPPVEVPRGVDLGGAK